MFTGFLGRIVVKPGFSRRPSLPTPINAAVQNLHKEVHHPSIVGFSGERMRHQPLGIGLNTQLFSKSWITVLP